MKGCGVSRTAVIYRNAACGLHSFCRGLLCVTWRILWLDVRRFAAPPHHTLWTLRPLLTFLKRRKKKRRKFRIGPNLSLHGCHDEPYFISDSLKLLITHPKKNRTANICTYFSDEAKLLVLRKKLLNEQSQKIIIPIVFCKFFLNLSLTHLHLETIFSVSFSS